MAKDVTKEQEAPQVQVVTPEEQVVVVVEVEEPKVNVQKLIDSTVRTDY